MKRVFIVANVEKPRVRPALDELLPRLKQTAEVVGVEDDGPHDLRAIPADLILILGGDGTLLSVARRLEGRPVPLLGVNFGRLGFLSSFTPDNFITYLERYLREGLPVRRRQMLQATVLPPGAHYDRNQHESSCKCASFVATALNDAVITAGPPFHMIELEISADSEGGVRYFGDGVIVSTSSGSTAYNVSAGGPIISADVEAFCITPICPHSLSFRPVVVSSKTTVRVIASRVNEGTTLFCDGQAMAKLCNGDIVVVRRDKHDVLLVEDPDAREWRSLAEKLNWAAGPKYNEQV
jgi:NAD+ kinase